MAGTLIDNPIAWAHFKVRGGWRNHLWSLAIYTLIIVLVIGITVHLSPMGGTLLLPWTNGLLGLELALLVFYGCNVISNSIRRDITSGLLESHRLMPIPPSAAIAGYLMGPPFQALLLATVSFLIGTALAAQSGIIDQWLMANVIALLFVIFLWGVRGVYRVCRQGGLWNYVRADDLDRDRGHFQHRHPGIQSRGRDGIYPGTGRADHSDAGPDDFLDGNARAAGDSGYAWGFLAQLVIGAIFFAARCGGIGGMIFPRSAHRLA